MWGDDVAVSGMFARGEESMEGSVVARSTGTWIRLAVWLALVLRRSPDALYRSWYHCRVKMIIQSVQHKFYSFLPYNFKFYCIRIPCYGKTDQHKNIIVLI